MTEGTDLVERIDKIRPERGDIVAVHVSDDDLAFPDSDPMVELQEQLGTIAQQTGATFVLVSETTSLEELDEKTMAAAGWIRAPERESGAGDG